MRISFFPLALCLLLFQQTGSAQWAYGLALKLNRATQLMDYPRTPGEGTFQASGIGTLGGTLFAETRISKHLDGILRLSYIRKGFRLPTQYGEIGTATYFEFDQVNTFDFIDADLLAMYRFKKRFIPKPYGGLRGGVLVRKKIGSYFEPFNWWDYPKEMHDFEKLTLGWVAGFRLSLSAALSLEMETNLEFVPVIRRTDFRSRNWVSSINIAFDLSTIGRKKDASF